MPELRSDRSTFVAALACALVVAAAPARSQDAAAPLPAAEFTQRHARHLLERAGFGGTPDEVRALHAKGLNDAVRSLVDYESIPDAMPPHGVEPVRRPPQDVLRRMSAQERQRVQNQLQQTEQRNHTALRRWWLARMLTSPRPLEEKLTLFWHGHFTSAMRDVRNAYHMAMQNDLLREHAASGFRRLLHEIARDPAMLRYLNNDRNVRRAPNENYARELMELFTLGLDAYTEDDVKSAARALTGFGLAESTFVFRPRDHDYGDKTLLGENGTFDGDDVVHVLLRQPAASRHLARRLLTWFAIEPTDAELAPYAELLLRSDYQLRPFLRTLFASRWFHSERVVGQRIKGPVELFVGFLRSGGAKSADLDMVARLSDQLGQALFDPPNVKGWDGGAAWITSSHLLGRANAIGTLLQDFARSRTTAGATPRGFATHELVANSVATPLDPAAIVDALTERFLAVPLERKNHATLVAFVADTKPTNARQRAALLDELLHLLCTTPEFQVH